MEDTGRSRNVIDPFDGYEADDREYSATRMAEMLNSPVLTPYIRTYSVPEAPPVPIEIPVEAFVSTV